MAQTCTNLGILYTEWYKSTDFLKWENPINAPGWFELANQYYDQVKDESLSLAKSGKAHNYHQWARMYHRIWEKNPNNKTYAENYFKKVDQAYEDFPPKIPKCLCRAGSRYSVICLTFISP
ncbi:MAG: hypothetical protein IPJ82_07720 [Lewinellaceae bacterium]|nr:hypothetical protein [Lewinellaceae bacterium]